MLKSTGIVRKVDELGRVVIPIELRRTLDIQERDALEIFTDDKGHIVLGKYRPGCRECGDAGVPLFGTSSDICRSCIVKLSEDIGK